MITGASSSQTIPSIFLKRFIVNSFKGLIVYVLINLVGEVNAADDKAKCSDADRIPKPYQRIARIGSSEQQTNKGNQSAKYTITDMIRQAHGSVAYPGGEHFH